MTTSFRTALLCLPLLALAGCLGIEAGNEGDPSAEAAEDLHRAVLPVPSALAPCIPGLPPSYPGCWPLPICGPHGPGPVCGVP